MVENARNLVGGCRDRLRCSQPGSHASEEFSEVPLSAAEGIRSHAKGDCRSVLYLPRPDFIQTCPSEHSSRTHTGGHQPAIAEAFRLLGRIGNPAAVDKSDARDFSEYTVRVKTSVPLGRSQSFECTPEGDSLERRLRRPQNLAGNQRVWRRGGSIATLLADPGCVNAP